MVAGASGAHGHGCPRRIGDEMASENLPVKHRCALLNLMTEGGRAANPVLQGRWALTLTGHDRVRLDEHGLVTSRRTGRSFTHELTDKGWRWCADELASEVPPRADVDAALVELSRSEGVVLPAEPNRKALTADDAAAAVRIGGEAKHLLAIDAT